MSSDDHQETATASTAREPTPDTLELKSFPKRPDFHTVEEEVDWLNARLDETAQQLHQSEIMANWLRRQLYGSKSECTKYDVPDQQTLFGVKLHVATDDKEVEKTLAQSRKDGAKKKDPKNNGGGRKRVNASLLTLEQIIKASAAEKIGPNGETLVLLGYEYSERLHIVAAVLQRILFKREKYGLPDTHETLTTAACLPSIVPKGKLTDGAIQELMYNKYVMSLPFCRQIKDYNWRGAELNASLCSSMAQRYAAFMQPISDAILQEILSEPYIHIDETTMRELNKGRMYKRYLWVWHAGGQSYFHYGGRGNQEIKAVLGMQPDELFEDYKGYHGFFMADAHSAYGVAAQSPTITLLACMVHARRYFEKIASNYSIAKEILLLFNGIFKIDRTARRHCEKHTLHGAEAHAHIAEVRTNESVPALAALKKRLDSLATTCVGITLLEKAIGYSLNHWEALTLYTTRGDLPMDNNAAERSIRPVTIGRKNYIFVGSEDAGDWTAVNYTILESARCQNIDPRWYQEQVTQALHQGRCDYENLTPKALKPLYKASQAAK